VAELAELSALGLRAGLAPADAAALACEVAGEAPRGRARRAARRSAGRGAPWGVVSAAVATARRDGTSVGAALAEVAAALRTRGVAGAEEVGLLGAAWRLSEETGAPAAPAAAGAAAVVRGRVRAAERRAALVAGPRASMTLLTALPLSGPVLTALVGLPVTQVYARGLVPAVVTLGLLLTAAGWWWARTSLQRALRGSPLRGGRR
jgi:tight adherence protein B